MPRKATKAADNVLYKARINAASFNDRLYSRDGASEISGIDRTRLAHMELGTIVPYPEEILLLSDAYNAPELPNYHCSQQCPIGRVSVEPIEIKGVPVAALQVLSAVKEIPELSENLLNIMADGEVSPEEEKEMEEVLESLVKASECIKSLELTYKKMLAERR